jgi:hypothetical protein
VWSSSKARAGHSAGSSGSSSNNPGLKAYQESQRQDTFSDVQSIISQALQSLN